MSQFPEVLDAVKGATAAVDALKRANEERLKKQADEIAELRDRIEGREALDKSPGRTGRGGSKFRTLRTQGGIELPYLSSEQKAADFYATARHDDKGSDFSVGQFVRDAMFGGREGKVASSTATVPTFVSADIIDRVRALTVVVRAGAGTIVVDGPTNLARITGDPTVYQHTEAAADISESDITAVAVTLNPKLLAALVPLTVELVQDSPNLDAAIQASVAGAFASKIDTLSIAKMLADAAIAKSGSAHDPATWAGTMSAITAALAADQELPRAHISTPANFMARAGQLASTAGSWLGKPPALEAMQELFTSSMTADTAVFGDFAAGFAIAVRTELTLEVVRHAKPTSASHLLVAHMRADGVVLQPGRLFIQKKVP